MQKKKFYCSNGKKTWLCLADTAMRAGIIGIRKLTGAVCVDERGFRYGRDAMWIVWMTRIKNPKGSMKYIHRFRCRPASSRGNNFYNIGVE